MATNIVRVICFMMVISTILGQDMGDAYCYNTDDKPYRLYSTKTKYDTVLNMKTVTHLNTSHIEGCEPSVFYVLARHGSRYTSASDISLMKDTLPKFQDIIASFDGSLCDEDKSAIKSWTMRMDESNDMVLAETGWNELRMLAKRYSQSFPNLMLAPYNISWFQFLHTEKDRTRDSARAFVEGLFGTDDGVHIEQLKKSEDWLLYFYKNCAKYRARLEGNHEMSELFKHGPEIQRVVSGIQNRTGLLMSDYDKMDDTKEILIYLYMLYETCSFEYQVYGDSPWCAIFTEDDLRILEYGEDIEYYWVDGYGDKINYEQTCDLLKDIVYYLRLDGKETMPTEKVLTRFAHSGALNMLLSKLGMYKDDSDLTSSDYDTSKERKWRTSYHNPMAGNIVFVRHDCSPNKEDKVAVYVNEELITLPVSGCTNGICPVSALSNEWLPTTRTCDVQEICEVDVINLSNKFRLSVVLIFLCVMVMASTK